MVGSLAPKHWCTLSMGGQCECHMGDGDEEGEGWVLAIRYPISCMYS